MTFAAALGALAEHDLDRLERLLDAEPELSTAREESDEGHYCGYFFRATLLHHVSGNPLVVPPPPAAAAALLLDHGAEVDASTEPGPSQPDDIGWTTLGLVASSGEFSSPAQRAETAALLVERGADVDARNGGALMGALYYGVRDGADWLVDNGARVDLVAAAGVGRVDLIDQFVAPSGEVGDDAHTLVHYSQVPMPADAGHPAILSLALTYAAMGGHVDAIDRLVGLGAEPDAVPPFDHAARPLHWAALRGHADACRRLVELGADRSATDATWSGTPSNWATEGGHPDLAATLAP